ncbi:glycosyltransferase [Pantoea dispersa]|uniref:glycosyltransferase n=1 Tax=Pantoea dispersa TaxID=59814 RepID=UPI0028DFF532|nr:glycosyltransferase [Pantoea dispersa]MDT8850943.1 glycosyltransferase [Pantoea dispersa]
MKNDFWFDLTTSMLWTGGVVGIVRAELEIGASLARIYPQIKFSMFKNGKFVALAKSEIPWIYTEGNVADVYLENRKSLAQENNKNINASEADLKVENFLKSLESELPSRGRRFQHALALAVEATPTQYKLPMRVLAWLPKKVVGGVINAKTLLNRTNQNGASNKSSIGLIEDSSFSHPYGEKDVILSVGWSDSGKEQFYTKVKSQNPHIKLGYMVYDTILVGDTTRHLYREDLEENFRRYFHWISENCDFIVYGGNSPQKDGIAYQNKHGWTSPPSLSVPYGGTDPVRVKDTSKDAEILSRLGIERDFLITVGTIEVRKNHDVLYKAMAKLAESGFEPLPQIVFVGRPGWRTEDLIDSIKRDPRIGNNIIITSPSDEELDVLYRNCKFTLLPSLYEGWALPMPESFSYGKACIASDIEPLHEIGKDFPKYLNPFDVNGWVEGIKDYISHPDSLRLAEERISQEWHSTTWTECGKNVLEAVEALSEKIGDKTNRKTIWYDLTLSYGMWRGGVTGIIRTELILAHYLSKIIPGIKFYAFHEDAFFEVPRDRLLWLFESADVTSQYAAFQRYWGEAEEQGRGHRLPFSEMIRNVSGTAAEIKNENVTAPRRSALSHYSKAGAYLVSALPASLRKKAIDYADRKGLIPATASPAIIASQSELTPEEKNEAMIQDVTQKLKGAALKLPFRKNDIVFSAGINWDERPLIEIIKARREIGFIYSQVIYDMTPLITPQLHAREAFDWYNRFYYLASLASNTILYGGETAKRDGQLWQHRFNWPITQGVAIKFGSDIAPSHEHTNDKEILAKLGVTGDYMLSVGTLEIRKNHEALYKAYLQLLEKNADDVPQMVFVGGPGWKAKDLFEIIQRDNRVKGKILLLRTSDQELDVLYRNCLFTLLPSLYEGWSLTLPESLGYGKFCLTSAVDPLMETGRDLVDYVSPWDVTNWAEKMQYYIKHPFAVKSYEERIKNEWDTVTWQDCANTVYKNLVNIESGKGVN